jgi:hypothetical protein
MKNSQLFEKKYYDIISKEEKVVLERFKEGVNNDLKYNYVSNGILKSYSEEINFYRQDPLIRESHRYIEATLDKYQGDSVFKINRILDFDFSSFTSKNEQEIDLTGLIENIAKLYALKIMQINFNNNYTTYSFMYKLNDFKEFTYKNIEKEHPELTEKLRLRIYPGSQTETIKPKKDYSKEIKMTNRYLETFSDTEKKVLLKAFYKLIESNFQSKVYKTLKDLIPITEFSKLVLIVSSLEEPEVFYKKSNQSSTTKKISEDFTRTEIEILNGLKERLADQKMTKTKDYIAGLIAKR